MLNSIISAIEIDCQLIMKYYSISIYQGKGLERVQRFIPLLGKIQNCKEIFQTCSRKNVNPKVLYQQNC